MKVAIIDDEINQDIITGVPVKKYFIEGISRFKYKNYSHSTKVAAILVGTTPDVEILNVVVLNGEKGAGSIKKLAMALKLLTEVDVDIISISLGTTKLSEYLYIEKYILSLEKKGVLIVAALNNNYHMTLPACMDGVIGVRYDHLGLLPDNSFLYSKNDLLNIELVVNCDSELIGRGIQPSNSFAVPVVIGKIINSCNKQGKVSKDLNYMKLCDTVRKYDIDYRKLVAEREEIPVCYFELENWLDVGLISKIMDFLYDEWGYEIGGGILKKDTTDYRLVPLESVNNIKGKYNKKFLWSILDIDILFLIVNQKTRGFDLKGEKGLYIKICEKNISIECMNKEIFKKYTVNKTNILELCELIPELIVEL